MVVATPLSYLELLEPRIAPAGLALVGAEHRDFTFPVSDLLAHPVPGSPLSAGVNELTFASRETTETVRVQARGATAAEDPPPSLSISDVGTVEGDTGQTSAVFTVRLSNPSSQVVSVQYVTADRTAFAPEDYSAVPLRILTFEPGDVTKSILIQLNGDTLFEFNERFLVDLSDPVNATIRDGQGEGTIANDDPLPEISIADVSTVEGGDGNTPASFAVTLSRPSSQPITVQYVTSDGSAAAPADYTPIPTSTLTFAPFETSKTVVVSINEDFTFEPDETFFVELSSPTGAVIAAPRAQGSILNDEPLPTISIADVTVAEGEPANFAVRLSGASSQGISVEYATLDSTATSPEDYTALSPTTLAFAPGEVSKLVSVEVKNDPIRENNETFFVALSNAQNAALADPEGRGTILNTTPLAEMRIEDVSALEGAEGTTTILFTVSLSRQSSEDVLVRYATTDGTARAPADYDPIASGTLTFDPGETRKTVAVTVRGDVIFESDETFVVELSDVVNAALRDQQGVGTILNDEPTPSLGISDPITREGNEGSATASFVVSLSGESSSAVSVQYATADGTATAPDDYAALALSTATFAPGERSKTINVEVKGDVVLEPDQTFFVDLSNAIGATITKRSGEGTILNDEGLPVVSIRDVTLAEGIRGTAGATFAVSLSHPSSEPVAVEYATADGSATVESDYHAVGLSTLTFAPGETSKVIVIDVRGDTEAEPHEFFYVNLSARLNATLGDSQAVGTILNDDRAVTFSEDGLKARFGDLDGDVIVVKTDRGVLTSDNFVFTTAGNWQTLDLRASEVSESFRGAMLTISAKTPLDAAGDGLVSLSAIDAFGLRLKVVKFDGALGQIDLGEGVAGKHALASLIVQSLGQNARTGEESTIDGTLGFFKAKGDLTGVLRVTGGLADRHMNLSTAAITNVVIGGDIDGSAGGVRAGLIDAAGDVVTVLVKGSVTGGGEMSGILIGGNATTITIAGNLSSADSGLPVTISALGRTIYTNSTAFVSVLLDRSAASSSEQTTLPEFEVDARAIQKLEIGGSVVHAQVLAGFGRDLTVVNRSAGVGSIEVAGNWNASSASAGILDVTGNGFGSDDLPIAGSGVISQIASITIRGNATGSAATGDFFGITAGQIGRIGAGSIRPLFTDSPDDFLLDPLNDDFRAVDFA